MNAVTTRLEPGIKGITFLKACAESDKALRRVYGFIVINSYNDLMMLKGKKSMVTAMFRDVQHVDDALAGKSDIEIGISDIPDPILTEIQSESDQELNFNDFVVISVVLTEAKVSYTARIWLDRDIFMNT